MHPSDKMKRTINGQRYTVATSTLLASNEYWDGHNFERDGRNTFLYRTSGGAYYRVDLSMWQGERNTVEPLSREEAMALWETLPEHHESYEIAFDAVVEEASVVGRPTYYGQAMKQTAIWLPVEMIEWLKSQGTMSEVVRSLVEQAMKKA